MSFSGQQSMGAGARRRYGRSPKARLVQWGVAGLAFVAVGAIVTTSSRAAFVAQNDNAGNTVTSASIDLTDDDGTAAMFSVVDLLPGVDQTRCITVTYTGNVDPTVVRLYRASVPTGGLAPYLNLTVETGAAIAAGFSGCAGFSPTATEYTGTLDGFSTGRTGYGDAAAATSWDPSVAGEKRTFRFTLSVQDVAAAEAKTTTFGFSWETRTS